MSRQTRSALIAAIVFALGIALPATGLITPAYGLYVAIAAIALLLTLALTPIEHRLRRRLLDRLPVGFRWPLFRKAGIARPLREAGELGALDLELLMTRAQNESNKVLGRIGNAVERIGSASERYSPRLAAAASSPTEVKVRLSKQYAREVGKPIDAMERDEAAYALLCNDINEYGIRRFQAFPPETDLAQLRPTMEAMVASVQGAKTGTQAYRDAVESQRRQNLQQQINEAADRQLEVIDRLLADLTRVEEFARNAVAEIDRRAATNRAQRRHPGE